MSLTVDGFENMIAGLLGIEEPGISASVQSTTQLKQCTYTYRCVKTQRYAVRNAAVKRSDTDTKRRSAHGSMAMSFLYIRAMCTVVARRCFARTAAHSRSALRLNGRTAGRHCCSRA